MLMRPVFLHTFPRHAARPVADPVTTPPLA
jgi:hypothetical protein